MSDKHEARKAVNNAISNAGSASVGLMVDTALSSKEKREANRKAREAEAKKREEMQKPGGDGAVRAKINCEILAIDNCRQKTSS